MKAQLQQLLQHAILKLQEQGTLPDDIVIEPVIEHARDKTHGDYATNLAMVMSRHAKASPRDLAQKIIDELDRSTAWITSIEIAGPGFINFTLEKSAKSQIIPMILSAKAQFGTSQLGANKKVLLEYVSANPTGPLHVGHGRGAAFGSTLANLLKTTGFNVTREYYVNDAGRQMNILAVSIWLRYLSLLDKNAFTFPSNAYKGDYVIEIAHNLKASYQDLFYRQLDMVFKDLPDDEPDGGDKEVYIDALTQRTQSLLGQEDFSRLFQFGLEAILADIKQDLHQFGVDYDNWFSERRLFEDGSLEKGIQALVDAGLTYEEKGALWFRSTDFGDEKDRVLRRANGVSTYFASDVAYHWNKYDRGFDRVINVFGADHHGYVARVKAAVRALGHRDEALEVLLVQFAILYRGKERVQMSTRSGEFVTLRELREEVGTDAARFFYVMRKADQHMDFDLELAKSQSNDNPVYYVQYAHARISSVWAQLKEKNWEFNQSVAEQNLASLVHEQEEALLDILNRYPEVIEQAAKKLEPHLIAYYLRELATAFHSYYNACPFLIEDEVLRNARLALILAVQQLLRNGLTILGVSAPENM